VEGNFVYSTRVPSKTQSQEVGKKNANIAGLETKRFPRQTLYRRRERGGEGTSCEKMGGKGQGWVSKTKTGPKSGASKEAKKGGLRVRGEGQMFFGGRPYELGDEGKNKGELVP